MWQMRAKAPASTLNCINCYSARLKEKINLFSVSFSFCNRIELQLKWDNTGFEISHLNCRMLSKINNIIGFNFTCCEAQFPHLTTQAMKTGRTWSYLRGEEAVEAGYREGRRREEMVVVWPSFRDIHVLS